MKLPILRDTTLCCCVSSADVMKDWSASSQVQALQQKAHLDSLTLKMKGVQTFERYLPDDEVSYTRRLEYSVKCNVQFFSSFTGTLCYECFRDSV